MAKLLQPFVSQFDGKSTLTAAEFIQQFEKYDKNGKITIWKISSEQENVYDGIHFFNVSKLNSMTDVLLWLYF